MKNVCHMTSAHQTADVRIFHKECVSLANAGYEVFLVGRGESREDSGVHVIGVGEPSGGRFARMTTFARRVYEAALALDADIYHFHDPELLPYGLKLKRHGKKVIFDSHESYRLQIVEKSYLGIFRKPVAWLYKRYEEYITRKIDAVVVVTQKMRELFMNGSAKTVVLANYPILRKQAIPIDRKEKNSKSADEPLVIYAGSLTESRGISNLARAINMCNARLALCGNFSDEQYQEKVLGLSDKIDYYGKLPYKAVEELYSKCAIGMCTHLKIGQYATADTMGTKVYEYMDAGLPVILTDQYYNVDMVRKYQFGICVDPDDPKAIANAIRYLLEHPEEARKMGENGQRTVRQTLSWNIEEQKLLELYEDVVHE